MKQIHVDLETLDTASTAQVLSLGACCEGMTLYVEVDTSVYKDAFTQSQATVEWWEKQGGFKSTPGTQLHTPVSMLVELNNFIHDVTKDIERNDIEIWANSPTFDLAILHHHYKVFSMRAPWEYWQERDVRTINALAKRLRMAQKAKAPHNALADAQLQEAIVRRVYSQLINLQQAYRDGVFAKEDSQ